MFPIVIDDLSAEFIELGDEILLRIELLIRIVGLWDVGRGLISGSMLRLDLT